MGEKDLLGTQATDTISGYTGTVDAVAYYLYGTTQVRIAAKAFPDGTIPAARWFDIESCDFSSAE